MGWGGLETGVVRYIHAEPGLCSGGLTCSLARLAGQDLQETGQCKPKTSHYAQGVIVVRT